MCKRLSTEKGYLTVVCELLLKEPQHKPLDPAFFQYAKEVGVRQSLLNEMKPRLGNK